MQASSAVQEALEISAHLNLSPAAPNDEVEKLRHLGGSTESGSEVPSTRRRRLKKLKIRLNQAVQYSG